MGATALRVEWAKVMAWAARWEEDVVLLDEEMRRVLDFCKWKADWWTKQVLLCRGLGAPLAEGLHAYAAKQADMEQRIHLAWSTKWARAQVLAQPIVMAVMGEASIRTQNMDGGPMRFEIDKDHKGIKGDSDFEE